MKRRLFLKGVAGLSTAPILAKASSYKADGKTPKREINKDEGNIKWQKFREVYEYDIQYDAMFLRYDISTGEWASLVRYEANREALSTKGFVEKCRMVSYRTLMERMNDSGISQSKLIDLPVYQRQTVKYAIERVKI